MGLFRIVWQQLGNWFSFQKRKITFFFFFSIQPCRRRDVYQWNKFRTRWSLVLSNLEVIKMMFPWLRSVVCVPGMRKTKTLHGLLVRCSKLQNFLIRPKVGFLPLCCGTKHCCLPYACCKSTLGQPEWRFNLTIKHFSYSVFMSEELPVEY